MGIVACDVAAPIGTRDARLPYVALSARLGTDIMSPEFRNHPSSEIGHSYRTYRYIEYGAKSL